MNPAAIAPFLQPAMQLAGGLYQTIKANQLKKQLGERPAYEIPEAQRQALESAKRQAYSTELPGQSILERKLGESTAAGVSNIKDAASSGSSALQAMLQTQGQEQDALSNIGVKAAENYNQNQGMLRGQQGLMAQYQDKALDINKMQPYQQKAATIAALTGSGLQNLFGAGAGAANAATTLQNQDMWKNYLMGGMNPNNTGTQQNPNAAMQDYLLNNFNPSNNFGVGATN